MKISKKVPFIIVSLVLVLSMVALSYAKNKISFAATQINISAASVEQIRDYAYRYTGSDIEPDPKVTLNGVQLVRGTDYTLSYSNNKNAGTAKITVTGINNYTGSVETTFNIGGKEIYGFSAQPVPDQVYTGEAIPVDPVIYDPALNRRLVKNVDYTCTTTAYQIGHWSARVNGQGNYAGSLDFEYNIVPIDITTAVEKPANVSNMSYYTGEPIDRYIPYLNLKSNKPVKDIIKLNEEYTVSYEDNINPGTAKVIITGINHYQGTLTYTFRIKDTDLSHATITGVTDLKCHYELPMSHNRNSIKVYLEGELVDPKYYSIGYLNNVEPGVATLIVSGSYLHYTGYEKRVTFNMISDDIASSIVSKIQPQKYTGHPITPEPTVKVNNVLLRKDIDYTLSYQDNLDTGLAHVIIEGKGDYAGSSRSQSFYIDGIDIEETSIDPIPNQTYTGSEIRPNVVVKAIGKTLVLGQDYDVYYEDNTEIGVASVKIYGRGNFFNAKELNFNILPISVNSLTIAAIPNQRYTGAYVIPRPVVKQGTKTLVKDVDYRLSYENNVNPGTATINITGLGIYGDTKKVTFNIVDTDEPITPPTVDPDPVVPETTTSSTTTKPISSSTDAISIKKATFGSISDKIYNGYSHTPNVKITYKNKTLTINKDYTLSYKDNINAGTATITIKGINGYKDSKKVTFNILALDLSSATVSKINSESYTGKQIKPKPTVTLNGKELVRDQDYKLTYKDNIEEGTATVTITGINNYEGTIKKKFNIVKKSSDKSLKTLNVNGEDILINYFIKVPSSTTSVNVEATTNDAKATISSSSLGEKEISAKNNVFNIEVTAEDDSTLTYSFIVYREVEDENLSKNNNIKSLTVNDTAVKFSANNNVLVTYDYDVEDIEFNLQLEDEKATYIINGDKNLSVGDNIFTILVVSESGDSKQYTLFVRRNDNERNTDEVENPQTGILTPTFAITISLATGGYIIYHFLRKRSAFKGI